MNSLLRRAGRLLPFLFATAFFTACSDSAVGPASPSQSLAASAGSSSASAAKSTTSKTLTTSSITDALAGPSAMTVGVLTFREGTNLSVTASKVIGSEGGFLSLAETGFILWVPPGAVSKPTTFKVTPVGGGAVAYDFEPHGAKFAAELIFKQDLSKTNYVPGMALKGAYFSDATKVQGANKTAEVSELFSIWFGDGGWAFFSIIHFSGYLVSCA